jgi:hypothetical protein
MKKVLFATIVMLQFYQTNAQSVSVNYTYNFVSTDEAKFKDKNLMPQTVSQMSLSYGQNLKKLPITVNITAAISRRKPPPLGLIPWKPSPITRFALTNKIEADSATFSKNNSTSFDFLIGAGYVLPHKAGSRVVLSVNADFGVSMNNKQALNFYFQKRMTGSVEVKQLQMIVNPSIKAKFSITNRVGINLGAGYSNMGGVNLTTGIIFNPFGGKGCSHWQCCGMCDWFSRKKGLDN